MIKDRKCLIDFLKRKVDLRITNIENSGRRLRHYPSSFFLFWTSLTKSSGYSGLII